MRLRSFEVGVGGKRCKDCMHYRRFLFFEPTCARVPKDFHWYATDPVTGAQHLRGNRYCITQRAWDQTYGGYQYCGPYGRYWEAKR